MKLTEAMRIRNQKLSNMDGLEGYLENLGSAGGIGGIPAGRANLESSSWADNPDNLTPEAGLTRWDLLKASLIGNTVGAMEILGVGGIALWIKKSKLLLGKFLKLGAIITAVLTLVNNLTKIDWEGEGVFEQVLQALLQTKTDLVRMLFDFVVGIPYAVATWVLDALGMHDTANSMREQEEWMRGAINDAMEFVDKVIFKIVDFFTERVRGVVETIKGLAIGIGLDPNSELLRKVKTGLGMDDISLSDMTTNKRGILGNDTESEHYKRQLAHRAAMAINNVQAQMEGINSGPGALTEAEAMYLVEENAEGVTNYPEVVAAMNSFYNSRSIAPAVARGVQPEKLVIDPITGEDTDPRLADALIRTTNTPVALGGAPKLKRILAYNDYFSPQTLQEEQITPFIGRDTQGGLIQRGSELMSQGNQYLQNTGAAVSAAVMPIVNDVTNNSTTINSNTTRIDMGPTVIPVDKNQINPR